MNYEERLRHRDLTERATRLREKLEEGDDGGALLLRTEGRELVVLLEETLAQISPERWDRIMEAIVDEATRRTRAPSLFD
ncbi:hypothetical protein [Candidatus Palauibacter sp.]|uniref:hypothetical protein n=1 Tax=Candidatus Palauibacter sp. TaxID=3101350 RepID=UPI003AF2C62D